MGPYYSSEKFFICRVVQEVIFPQWSYNNKYTNYKDMKNYLDGSPPANNQCHIVLPAETAGIHIWAKTYIISGHIGDSLLGSDVKNLHTLENRTAL